MIVTHGTDQYRVTRKVAEAATYRVYICEDHTTGEQYLLQIATELQHNGGLDRAAFILKVFKQTSDRFESEYAVDHPERQLNYDRLFPHVVSSFVSSEQGNRRINIFSVKDVKSVTEMVPLSNLIVRDGLRVDLETSAWIMGRLLKLLAFAHNQGVAVRTLSTNNVLIQPQNHMLVVFDWSSAYSHQKEVSAANRKDDIARAAQTVLAGIGGDPTTLEYHYDISEDNRRYVEILQRLARGRESNAEQAHQKFYELVDELFGRGFRPFKTLPR